MKKKDIIVTHLVKMGGYHYFNRQFPFYHFMKESLIVGTNDGIYKYKNGKYEKMPILL